MPIDTLEDNLHIAMQKLQKKEEILNQIESLNKLGSWELDLKTNTVTWSNQMYVNYGYNKDEVTPSLEFIFARLLPKYHKAFQDGLTSITTTGKEQQLSFQIFNSSEEIRDATLHAKVLYNQEHTPIKIIGTTQDTTHILALEKENNELSHLMEVSSNEIYIVDIHSLKYLYVNQGACDALGYTKGEFYKMNIYDINPHLTEDRVKIIKTDLIKEKKYINKTVHQKKDGTLYHAQTYMHTVTYKGCDAYVIFDTDISKDVAYAEALEQQKEKLHHQAHHDNLTQLPNRTLFLDRLEQTIISAKRYKKEFALMFLDLDQFKKINDSLGHTIGDELLVEASKRLKKCIREEDTIARLGGDEFTVILKNVQNIQNISTIAQKIIDAMRQPIMVKTHALYISVSIGISMYPKDATTSDALIKDADAAMYKAKEEGRDNFQYYKSSMTAHAFERVVMDTSLRVAIKEEQFIVYFQPQTNILNDTITGMEALVRWQHPSMGLVPPGKFIPIAEDSGLIIEIDKIVMKKAMQQFAQWYSDGLSPGILSLNLAMKQLNENDFIDNLLKMMQDMKLNPKWLELEVTEGQVMQNPELSIQKLHQISQMGIEIAIDDFGTGYSSLSYLKKLPLNKLKIDQSFVYDIPNDADDMAITKAIIALGKSLKLKLIAEGVETQEQKNFLIENGCDLMQGYLFSRPIPAEEITKLLKV